MNEQEKWFDDARTMFGTEGWSNFIKDINEHIQNIRVERIEDEKGFWIAKGQLNILHSIAGYENMIRASEEQTDAEDF